MNTISHAVDSRWAAPSPEDAQICLTPDGPQPLDSALAEETAHIMPACSSELRPARQMRFPPNFFSAAVLHMHNKGVLSCSASMLTDCQETADIPQRSLKVWLAFFILSESYSDQVV